MNLNSDPVYNFEKAVETACVTVLKSWDIAAVSSQDASQFQKQRPRVEVFFQKLDGLGRWVSIDPATSAPIAPPVSGPPPDPRNVFYMRCESAWNCVIRFDLFTAYDINIHSAFRAQCRQLLSILPQMINSQTLVNHRLDIVSDGGDSVVMENATKDWMKTSMTLRGKISILASAWPLLNTEPNTQ